MLSACALHLQVPFANIPLHILGLLCKAHPFLLAFRSAKAHVTVSGQLAKPAFSCTSACKFHFISFHAMPLAYRRIGATMRAYVVCPVCQAPACPAQASRNAALPCGARRLHALLPAYVTYSEIPLPAFLKTPAYLLCGLPNKTAQRRLLLPMRRPPQHRA